MNKMHPAALALIGLLAAGCGSSSAGSTATPTPSAHVVQQIARNEQVNARATVTAGAAANATAVAVQRLAAGAVARLQATAASDRRAGRHVQQVSHGSSDFSSVPSNVPFNKYTAPTVTPVRPVVRVPVATPVLIAVAPPPVVVHPTAVRPVRAPTARPVATAVTHRLITPVARPVRVIPPWMATTQHGTYTLLSCCRHNEYRTTGEKISPPFVMTGGWSFYARGHCGNVHNTTAPYLSVAVVPRGSTQPVTILRVTGTSRRNGARQRFSSPSGAYYLDVLSACHDWKISVSGSISTASAFSVPAQAQATPLAYAAQQGLSGAFAADRLAIQQYMRQAAAEAARTRQLAQAAARAQAEARRRAAEAARRRSRYVASLKSILSGMGRGAEHLRLAQAVIDPTSVDYSPSLMNRAAGHLGAALYDFTRLQIRLQHARAHGSAAARHDATLALASYMRSRHDTQRAILDLEAGDTGRCSVDLAAGTVDLARGDAAFNSARGYLEGSGQHPHH